MTMAPRNMPSLELQLLPGEFAVCRLPPKSPEPAWAGTAPFGSVTRTADELSVICTAEVVPPDVRAERGWRLLELCGPFPFDAVGILASVIDPLAAAGIGVLALGTFDTDYVLVKAGRLDAALGVLVAAGHRVR